MHSPINRSQTPLHHSSTSPTPPARKRPQSNSSSGSRYLQHVLGDVLAEALSQVAKKRPADPIQYVADYLHSVSSDDNQTSNTKDSGHVSDGISNRQNGSDLDRPDSNNIDRRSRRDTHTGDGNRNTKQNYGTIAVSKEVDNFSENSLSTGRSKNRRRRRRSRRSESDTQSLPPIGKPGSTTTNSTASTENANHLTNRNRNRSVSRNRNRSVSLHRGNEQYERKRNRSRRRTYGEKNNDTESIEKDSYAQVKIGKADIVSKKRSNVSPPKRKPTTFSRRLPAVADYNSQDYKSKRGMNSNVKLPPMSESPRGRTFSTSDPSSLSSNGSYGSRGVRKPRQLEPLEADISTFDSKRHRKRTQKLVEQRYR